MKRETIILLLLSMFFCFMHVSADIDQIASSLHVKGVFYLVFNLSDGDFNRRLNTFHIEPQLELTEGVDRAKIIKGALVKVNGVPLPFRKKRYRIKKILLKHQIPVIYLSISLPSGVLIEREIAIPHWLKMISPLPAVYDNRDLLVRWIPLKLKEPVKLQAYNLLDGKTIFSWKKVSANKQIIGRDLLPKRALVKIDIIESRFHSISLKGRGLSAESEIKLFSRSQVVLRTR